MTRPSRLLTTAAAGATAALLLAGCGGGGGDEKPKGGIAGADTGRTATASPSASAPPAPGRPKIDLPSDLSYTFDWSKTGEAAKDAVLADSEESIKAVDLAIANQDPMDKAYRFYYEGEAAAQIQQYVQAYVKAKARTTGHYRYYDPVVDVTGSDQASLVYCEDQGKAYDLYLKTNKVDKTAVTKNSYVLYSSKLRKNEKGVWAVEKLMSVRGSAKCQP
ncbi:hypothetical protein QQY24_19430 [Streptomyces sp. TG1A-8]|uniref:hypothetical protein n=1 Tax=Streptomyces sp. TG1A-8 TaxID=3051385 RepID=UPI00265BC27B|nr:hypothetical protein [Streptomyces sp. TG1A-8]MDO0927478.1 hypothetical protein [Streptomyces sp. TG1A-8]